jgi:hypothetical protein
VVIGIAGVGGEGLLVQVCASCGESLLEFLRAPFLTPLSLHFAKYNRCCRIVVEPLHSSSSERFVRLLLLQQLL